MKNIVLILFTVNLITLCSGPNSSKPYGNPISQQPINFTEVTTYEPESFLIDSLASPLDFPDIDERYDTSALGWHIIVRRLSDDRPMHTIGVTPGAPKTYCYNATLYLHVRFGNKDVLPLTSFTTESFESFIRENVGEWYLDKLNDVRIQSPARIDIFDDHVTFFICCDDCEYERLIHVKINVDKNGNISFSRFQSDYECFKKPLFYNTMSGDYIRRKVADILQYPEDVIIGDGAKGPRQRAQEIDMIIKHFKNQPKIIDSLINIYRNTPAENERFKRIFINTADELESKSRQEIKN